MLLLYKGTKKQHSGFQKDYLETCRAKNRLLFRAHLFILCRWLTTVDVWCFIIP